MNKYERIAKYGMPERIDDLSPNVLQFVHSSEEAAQASAQANRDEYGHPSWVESYGEVWVSIVDLNPAIERLEARID